MNASGRKESSAVARSGAAGVEEVVVVGAGPSGLWLASELALAGVQVCVLESELERSPHSKALGIHARTIEMLAMRGQEQGFLEASRQGSAWHFGMLESHLDFSRLNTPYPFMMLLPQAGTERLFAEYAEKLGVRVLRGYTATGVRQDPVGGTSRAGEAPEGNGTATVTAEGPDGPARFTARYVVGCDGSHSVVRRTAGIGFTGTDTTQTGFLGEVVLDTPPAAPGTVRSDEEGTLVTVPVGDGRHRVFGWDPNRQGVREPLTLAELRESTVRLGGSDFGMHDPTWLSRVGNATRVADHYRTGRVLVAGDAAHIFFPTGGLGLNTAVQDSMNLGWKLAAVVQGRARPDLLGTYEAERRPVALQVGGHTLAQSALLGARGPQQRALRALVNEMLAVEPGFARRMAERTTSLSVSYPPADPGAHHPDTGARAVPRDAKALFRLLQPGRAVLLTAPGVTCDAGRTNAAARGIGTHTMELWDEVTATLVRPDGYVWWASDERVGLDDEISHAVADLPAVF